MAEMMVTAVFARKATTLEEIANRTSDNTAQAFVTERVILLSDADYEDFKQNGLMQDCEFFFDNKESMWFDPEKSCWHCLLVKGVTSTDGVLVESEGFSYARYAAYAPDCEKIVLNGVPVETQYIESAPAPKRKPRNGRGR